MIKNQQEQALQYFNEHAEDWLEKAKAPGERKVNNIRQRNGFVLEVIKDREKTSAMLDIGCGTGDLVCDAAKLGIDAIGVDFAEDMIKLSVEKAQEDQLENAHFECCSIFDFDFTTKQYDVIAANGFIEYISQKELGNLLDIIYDALPQNGSFVVGSRNRLFNLSSLNAFTSKELDENNAEALFRESVAIASGKSIEEITKIEPAPLQDPETKHTKTNIDVATRFQYTPLQMVNMVKSRGFEAIEIFPIHIHGVPPAFKAAQPGVHVLVSNLLQTYARQRLELVPFSSSFMLHAQKR
jgi:2-polyprenyl-3-methyl-5-hydroxy-6-metoxy-1,4-benzoquinol methylase